MQDDVDSRNMLSILLQEKKVSSFEDLFQDAEERFKNKKCTFVFGAGPSLRDDILALYPLARRSNNLVIAADGAADALAAAMIFPQIIVTDLDSCSEKTMITQSNLRLTFIHAHGDNKELIENTVPKLGKRILGTTQVPSSENVKNLGGLTDGDRACYIASALGAQLIVTAGMDFGLVEGEYSKDKRSLALANDSRLSVKRRTRRMKMELGKQSLEFLIKTCQNKLRFVNMTSRGQSVKGANKESLDNLIKEIS